MHTTMYTAYVNASKPRGRGSEADRREALAWLGRQLAWEHVLGRLNEPGRRPSAPTQLPRTA
jgi:hypothetical protein